MGLPFRDLKCNPLLEEAITPIPRDIDPKGLSILASQWSMHRSPPMNDQDKTKEELIAELLEMRQRITQLETSLATLKQRDEAEQEAGATCKAMIEAFDGLVYVCSPNHEVEFMNECLIQRTGYNPIGEKCYQVLHLRDEICPWCVNGRVQLGETVRWEAQIPKDNRWYYIVNTPVRRRDGTISKMGMIQLTFWGKTTLSWERSQHERVRPGNIRRSDERIERTSNTQ